VSGLNCVLLPVLGNKLLEYDMITQSEIADLETDSGTMRCYVYRPVAAGRYPAIMFFSEIFQQTEPIQRAATMLAGHGFLVVVPEIFHELNPLGTVLAYDDVGKEKGNSDKITKKVEQYDSDVDALVAFLESHPASTAKIGSMGICIGGHLSFRAAMHPSVLAASCLYATDIHSSTLGEGQSDDSLRRVADIDAELQMIWGRQDPHVPAAGRLAIYQALTEADRNFTWHEFNAPHAFLRDEGHRYDPELSLICYQLAIALFHRKLSQGDLPPQTETVVDSDC
jgi:carboxymethylenebutenolidase